MRSDRSRRRSSRIVLYLLLALACVPFIYPMVWMLFAPFKTNDELMSLSPSLWPQQWTLDGVKQIFTVNPYARQWLNSLYIATVVTVGVVVLGAMAGYAFARIRFWGANLFFLMLVSAMLVPSEITIIPVFRWVSQLGLLDNHLPLIILPMLGPGSVVAVFIFRQFFLSLPGELEDAARVDGLGRWGIFWRIAFPLAGPAIGAVAIMTFLRSFNLYLEPLVLLRTPELFPVSLGITRYDDMYGEPLFNTQLGATALAVIPVLVVFVFAQRQFVEGLSSTGLKG